MVTLGHEIRLAALSSMGCTKCRKLWAWRRIRLQEGTGVQNTLGVHTVCGCLLYTSDAADE
eukprot:14432304-Heterocapsa_arctica.AAC.1